MREFKKKFKALGMGCLVESGACPAFSLLFLYLFFSFSSLGQQFARNRLPKMTATI